MKLWKRAAGVLKDQNSIWIASISRRTALRNPDVEEAVIKATTHNDSHVDYKSAQRIFAWLRTSPSFLKPLIWSISTRMEKTRSWVVAIKGLMLLHGVFSCKVPEIQKIGRLPFDLSNFKDRHSNPSKTWARNAFVRSYYAFVDQKSTFLFIHSHDNKRYSHRKEDSMLKEIVWLQNLQRLLDMLLDIKPQEDGMVVFLILEAMDCIIIEIFDIYSKICNGIAKVLMRIYSVRKVEAAMALRVLHKANQQSEDLSLYFEFCRDIGVINASECPKVEQIPEEDIQELENIIHGVSEESNMKGAFLKEGDKAMVVRNYRNVDEQSDTASSLQTIITDEWEVFDEDPRKVRGETSFSTRGMVVVRQEPLRQRRPGKVEDLPDLISF